MDLPKELRAKHLPKAKTAQTQHSAASTSDSPPESGPVSDDALFMQAMQGIVKAPKSSKTAQQHGTFPLHERRAFQHMNATSKTSATLPVDPPPESTCPHEALSAPPVVEAMPIAADENDFALAMRTVKPLKGKGRDIMPEVAAVDARAAQGAALQDLLDGDIVFDVLVSGETIQGHVVGLDEKSLYALTSGQHSPEARLDLHGMNALQAFQALVPFFRSAWQKGLRTVIVVTGRGVNSPTGMAVLRHKLHTWLIQEPFKRVVMAFSTARPGDGGAGSMYILLRKYRKKHKVYWERSPSDSDVFS